MLPDQALLVFHNDFPDLTARGFLSPHDLKISSSTASIVFLVLSFWTGTRVVLINMRYNTYLVTILRPFILLSVIILFYNNERNRLLLFVCRKSSAAFITRTSSSDRVFIFCRTRINHSRIRISTIWTSHEHFRLSLSIFYMRNLLYHTLLKFLQKFFFFNLHKHDIRTDLFYAGKGNHIFTICPEKSAYFPRSGITIASISPVHMLISTSAIQPRRFPLHTLITSFSFSSQIRIPPHRHFTLFLIYYMNEQFRHAQSRNPFLFLFFQFMRYNNISKTNKNIFI